MKSRIVIWLITLLFVTLFQSSVSLATIKSRLALVIGNSNYKTAPLRNPANDASDMASALRELGFIVMLKIDANQKAMERAIRDFGRALRKGDVGLFYFAGHGIQVHGRNYLIPIGAVLESESDAKYEAVDAGLVLGKMEDAGNNLNIIILDACRDNPFARSFRSSEKGLAKMDAPTGSFLAYATAPGSVAADGTGRNGLYTSNLLKHMMTPGLELEKLFKYVRIEVANASGKTQVPWESSSLMGDFYFNPKRGITVVDRPSVDKRESVVETPKHASISPKVTEPRIIGSDVNFVKFDTGVVYDKNTGLEWYAGPDRKTNWNEAKAWVESLNVAGGGWRMPTRDELKTLYQKGVGTRHMTPLLKTTGWWVWSGETKGSSSAWGFYFHRGRVSSSNRGSSWYYNTRGFAVRSRK